MAKQRFITKGFEDRSKSLRQGRGGIFRGKMASRVITARGRKLRDAVRERESRNWQDWS